MRGRVRNTTNNEPQQCEQRLRRTGQIKNMACAMLEKSRSSHPSARPRGQSGPGDVGERNVRLGCRGASVTLRNTLAKTCHKGGQRRKSEPS